MNARMIGVEIFLSLAIIPKHNLLDKTAFIVARAGRLLDQICLYFSPQFCVTRYLDDHLCNWRINAKKEEALIPFKALKIANSLHWIVEGRYGRKKTTVFLRFLFLPYPQISNHAASDWSEFDISGPLIGQGIFPPLGAWLRVSSLPANIFTHKGSPSDPHSI